MLRLFDALPNLETLWLGFVFSNSEADEQRSARKTSNGFYPNELAISVLTRIFIRNSMLHRSLTI